MAWWDVVLDKVNPGDKLFTPGRGLKGSRRKPFTIVSKDTSKIIIKSGGSKVHLEKTCFDVIEKVLSEDPSLWLRVASLHDSEPLEDSADKLIREATGSQLARGNYVCSILEYCGLARYSMHGNQKGIELTKKLSDNRKGKSWYKDYQFWTLIVTSMTFVAITFFAWQSQKVQTLLGSIEATRQKERFCDALKIHFDLNSYTAHRPEEAKYELRIINSSSHIYEALKTSVVVLFENPSTKEIRQAEVFTFPARTLPPTDKPVYLLENPVLTKTIEFNVTEAKKIIPRTFQVKYFCFCFRWRVNLGNGQYLEIEKRKNFVVGGRK